MKNPIYLLLFCLLCGLQAAAQTGTPSGRYFVKLHTGEIITANKLQKKSPLFKASYFLLDDTLQFNPSTIAAYQDDEGYYARIEPGNTSEAFAKRILEGPRIDKFYSSRTTYDYGYGYSPYGYGMPRNSRRRIYYFSKDDGPLYLLNIQNLEEALRDNEASMLLLNRHRREKRINTGVTIAGAGMMLAGTLISVNNSKNNIDGSYRVSPLMYAGAAVLGGQLVINLFQKDKLTQAMQVYNYQVQP